MRRNGSRGQGQWGGVGPVRTLRPARTTGSLAAPPATRVVFGAGLSGTSNQSIKAKQEAKEEIKKVALKSAETMSRPIVGQGKPIVTVTPTMEEQEAAALGLVPSQPHAEPDRNAGIPPKPKGSWLLVKYYNDNRLAIEADVAVMGLTRTAKRWGISGRAWGNIRQRWAAADEAAKSNPKPVNPPSADAGEKLPPDTVIISRSVMEKLQGDLEAATAEVENLKWLLEKQTVKLPTWAEVEKQGDAVKLKWLDVFAGLNQAKAE